MNSVDIGKKIKEARLAKKMTQSEVVGDFITRNMLSQIESGTALPSVKTLEYLCSVLDISLNMLEEENKQTDNDAYTEYNEIKKSYENGDLKRVADIESDYGVFTDEITSLSAKSCWGLGEKLSQSDNPLDMQQAIEYYKKSALLAKKGIFCDRYISENAEKQIKKLAEKLSEYYKNLI
ncbi:MAG: helix-turn-helix domain-containing protein [Hominimerdicola sp.]